MKKHRFDAIYYISRIGKLGLGVFSPRSVSSALGIPREKTNNVLARLAKKGLVERIQKGCYSLVDLNGEKANALAIAWRNCVPSYAGFFSALSLHSMTEQVPKKVFLATTRRKKSFSAGGMQVILVRISGSDYWGFEEVGSGEEKFLVSEKEKTVIDCLSRPELCGGIPVIAKAVSECDARKLVECAKRKGSKSIASRLGFLMKRAGMNTTGLGKLASKSFVKLDKNKAFSKKWGKEWRVNDNGW
jgi:predicted transcriptional regulator of viral defense system